MMADYITTWSPWAQGVISQDPIGFGGGDYSTLLALKW